MQPTLTKPERSLQVYSGCGLGGVGLVGVEVLVGLGLSGGLVSVRTALCGLGVVFTEVIWGVLWFSRPFLGCARGCLVRVQLCTFWLCRWFLRFLLFGLLPKRAGIWRLCCGVNRFQWPLLRLRNLLGVVCLGSLELVVLGLGSSGALMNTVVKQPIYIWLYINLVHC
jgi:hypothetical protein